MLVEKQTFWHFSKPVGHFSLSLFSLGHFSLGHFLLGLFCVARVELDIFSTFSSGVKIFSDLFLRWKGHRPTQKNRLGWRPTFQRYWRFAGIGWAEKSHEFFCKNEIEHCDGGYKLNIFNWEDLSSIPATASHTVWFGVSALRNRAGHMEVLKYVSPKRSFGGTKSPVPANNINKFS